MSRNCVFVLSSLFNDTATDLDYIASITKKGRKKSSKQTKQQQKQTHKRTNDKQKEKLPAVFL